MPRLRRIWFAAVVAMVVIPSILAVPHAQAKLGRIWQRHDAAIPSPTTADAIAPRAYIALGDSAAHGAGASSPFNHYVYSLFQYLKGPHTGAVELGVNFARPNETSSSFITDGQLTNAVAQINNPDNDVTVVTLTIGGYDLLQLLKPGQPCETPQSSMCVTAVSTALNTFASNYSTILQQLQQALADDSGPERLLIMTYYNPFSGVGDAAALYEQAVDAVLLGSDGKIDCATLDPTDARIGLNDLIVCIGNSFEAQTVDVYPLFKDKGLLLTHIGAPTPDVHPNDAGHAVIADTFIRAMMNHIYLPIIVLGQ
jgi:lysophospholipase L1-like esterase